MKVNCPFCKASLPSSILELGKDKVECPFCMSNFNISEVIKELDKEEITTRDKELSGIDEHTSFSNTNQPPGKKIKIIDFGLVPEIIISDSSFYTGCFFIIFTTFWNSIVITFTISALMGSIKEKFIFLFLIPFWLVAIVTLGLALFFTFGKTKILLGKESWRVRREVFGIGFNKNISTNSIINISMKEAYRQNNTAVYGIGITGDKKCVFGSALSNEQKNWVIDFLNNCLKDLPQK